MRCINLLFVLQIDFVFVFFFLFRSVHLHNKVKKGIQTLKTRKWEKWSVVWRICFWLASALNSTPILIIVFYTIKYNREYLFDIMKKNKREKQEFKVVSQSLIKPINNLCYMTFGRRIIFIIVIFNIGCC